MTLLHLESSSRIVGSRSRQVARDVQHQLAARVPDRPRRVPGPGLPAAATSSGRGTGGRAACVDRSDSQRDALALQDQAIEEFSAADAYLLSMPLYNYGVPSRLKAYVDHVLATGRVLMVDGSPSPVAGRPATVVVSFGVGYGPGTPRAEFDFVRPFLSKVLVDSLALNVEFSAVELTLAAHVPAMAGLVELGGRSGRDALPAPTG